MRLVDALKELRALDREEDVESVVKKFIASKRTKQNKHIKQNKHNKRNNRKR